VDSLDGVDRVQEVRFPRAGRGAAHIPAMAPAPASTTVQPVGRFDNAKCPTLIPGTAVIVEFCASMGWTVSVIDTSKTVGVVRLRICALLSSLSTPGGA